MFVVVAVVVILAVVVIVAVVVFVVVMPCVGSVFQGVFCYLRGCDGHRYPR